VEDGGQGGGVGVVLGVQSSCLPCNGSTNQIHKKRDLGDIRVDPCQFYMVSRAHSSDTSTSLMTHKYRGSQQSSREVLPKFIDSTQGEPKNICKP
jgi:hypothetical protein